METNNLPKHNSRPLVLVIAGVDSGGGAGVTADIMSVHDQGAWGMPLITAYTCQSLDRITLVDPVKVEVFNEALNLALNDWDQKIAAVKVGVICNAAILEAVLKALEGPLAGVPVVWDPVLTATSGDIESADIKANLSRILKVTTVFTPNIPEAMELTGRTENDIKSDKDILAMCDELIAQGANAILLKGGHNISGLDAVDTFKSKKTTFKMSHAKKDGLGAHGGGCALSSSIAGLIACGYAIEDAVVMGKVYVTRGIFETEMCFEHKRPPIAHKGLDFNLDYMPKIVQDNFPEAAGPFPKCPFNLGIYPVVDSADWVQRLLSMGVKTIQLRIKTDKHDDESNEHLVNEIKRACFLGHNFRARIFIDDHYKLAAKFGAYGVHLGMEDLQTADLEFIKNAGLRLGVSTHGIFEVCKVLTLQPSYIAIGHIFPTQTKDMESKPQGIERMGRQAMMLKNRIPTVAIGGIKLNHAQEILDAGIDSIAVVTAITKSSEPFTETQKWIELLRTGPSERYKSKAFSWHKRQDEQEVPGPVPFKHLELHYN